MTTLRLLTCLGLFLLSAPGTPQDRPEEQAFVALDVFVDPGAARLAAWQLEVQLETGHLVGVEGGEPTAFRDAPRYDPKALQGDRVILAALANGADLPAGRVRVARVHVVVERRGEPLEYAVRGVIAANADGERIDVDAAAQRSGDKR